MSGAQNLSNCLNAYIDEIADSSDEVKKLYKIEKLERSFAVAAEQTFKKAAPLVLHHINEVCLLSEKNGLNKLIVYADDSGVRASIDARQGILKHFLEKEGISYVSFQILQSKRSIKNRHPFENTQKPAQKQVLRVLTPEELAEIEEFVAPVDDFLVRESLKKALIADLQTSVSF